MKKEEEKQFNQLFNNEEHCEELNIIRYNVLKFIDENYISKVEVLEEIEKKILEDLQHDKNHFCKHYGEQFKECAKCYVERKFKELK